jgi:acyl-CoA synthetase (NDP forming)
VPNFLFPESAAAVLGRSWAYGRWRATEAAAPPADVEVDAARADELLRGAVDTGAIRLDPPTAAELLTAYGIDVPTTRFVAVEEAAATADRIGYPIAVKARRRQIGRSVRAGVALDLLDSAGVAAAIGVMRGELGDDADLVVVQAMVPPGVDLRIHVTIDEESGPLVSVGVGGIQAGLVEDREQARLAPLSAQDAAGLVTESRAGQMLAQAGIDTGRFTDTVIRAAQLAGDHREIVALDLNPVITSAAGCYVTDAVVEVAPVVRPAAALRRL